MNSRDKLGQNAKKAPSLFLSNSWDDIPMDEETSTLLASLAEESSRSVFNTGKTVTSYAELAALSEEFTFPKPPIKQSSELAASQFALLSLSDTSQGVDSKQLHGLHGMDGATMPSPGPRVVQVVPADGQGAAKVQLKSMVDQCVKTVQDQSLQILLQRCAEELFRSTETNEKLAKEKETLAKENEALKEDNKRLTDNYRKLCAEFDALTVKAAKHYEEITAEVARLRTEKANAEKTITEKDAVVQELQRELNAVNAAKPTS